MDKPPKLPRPRKLPIVPGRPGQKFDPSVSQTTEKLIGRAVVAWSKLENCMDDFIWALLAIPIEKGRIITGRMDAVRKIQTLRSLGKRSLAEEKFYVLSPTLDLVDLLRDHRNLVVHGSWGRTFPENETIVLSLKPESPNPSEVVAENFPDTRLRALISEIERAKGLLIPLMEEHYASLDKSLRQDHENR